MSLQGRVALVTGGSRGIGSAIARKLAEAGADVAVNYRRDEKAAGETVAAIEKMGRKARAYRAAVDAYEEVRVMIESVLADFGHIDILVNNAGIASRGHTVADTDPLELERVLRVHAMGSHALSQLVLPSMRTRKRGDILMISSAATLNNAAGGAPYNMAKAAMEALAFTLAKEERANGIHVNVVAPGLVVTEMGRRLVKGAMQVDDIESMALRMPFERLCRPEDIAGVCRFLVSDAAGYVTGEKITVHGGGQS